MAKRNSAPPRRCLLAQAANWISHGKLPITDDAFLAAPEYAELDNRQKRDFYLALFDNDCDVKGNLFAEYTFREEFATDRYRFKKKYSLNSIQNHKIDLRKTEISDLDIKNNIIYYTKFESDLAASNFFKEMSTFKFYDSLRLILCDVTVDFNKLMNNIDTGVASLNSYATENYAADQLPYLAFMIDAAKSLGLSPKKRVPTKIIKAWLSDNWPERLGKPTHNKLTYMATFLRRPEDEKGGYQGADNRST